MIICWIYPPMFSDMETVYNDFDNEKQVLSHPKDK